jgi:alpha-beta hydrolase superfamily lysophospholipase
MVKIAKPLNQKRIPKTISIYILAGTEDPISNSTQRLNLLVAALRRAGVTRVEQRFYAGGRHEMLKEVNREEVVENLIAWMDRVG